MAEERGQSVSRIRLEFEDGLCPQSGELPGISRCWYCLPSSAETIGSLAQKVAADFGLHSKGSEKCEAKSITFELEGFSLLPSSPCAVLRDGDILVVRTLECMPAARKVQGPVLRAEPSGSKRGAKADGQLEAAKKLRHAPPDLQSTKARLLVPEGGAKSKAIPSAPAATAHPQAQVPSGGPSSTAPAKTPAHPPAPMAAAIVAALASAPTTSNEAPRDAVDAQKQTSRSARRKAAKRRLRRTGVLPYLGGKQKTKQKKQQKTVDSTTPQAAVVASKQKGGPQTAPGRSSKRAGKGSENPPSPCPKTAPDPSSDAGRMHAELLRVVAAASPLNPSQGLHLPPSSDPYQEGGHYGWDPSVPRPAQGKGKGPVTFMEQAKEVGEGKGKAAAASQGGRQQCDASTSAAARRVEPLGSSSSDEESSSSSSSEEESSEDDSSSNDDSIAEGSRDIAVKKKAEEEGSSSEKESSEEDSSSSSSSDSSESRSSSDSSSSEETSSDSSESDDDDNDGHGQGATPSLAAAAKSRIQPEPFDKKSKVCIPPPPPADAARPGPSKANPGGPGGDPGGGYGGGGTGAPPGPPYLAPSAKKELLARQRKLFGSSSDGASPPPVETWKYDDLPLLTGSPQVGDVLAYKILEIGWKDGCPRVSAPLRGRVSSLLPPTDSTAELTVQLTPWPDPAVHPRAAEVSAWKESQEDLAQEEDYGDKEEEEEPEEGAEVVPAMACYEESPFAATYQEDGTLVARMSEFVELRLVQQQHAVVAPPNPQPSIVAGTAASPSTPQPLLDGGVLEPRKSTAAAPNLQPPLVDVSGFQSHAPLSSAGPRQAGRHAGPPGHKQAMPAPPSTSTALLPPPNPSSALASRHPSRPPPAMQRGISIAPSQNGPSAAHPVMQHTSSVLQNGHAAASKAMQHSLPPARPQNGPAATISNGHASRGVAQHLSSSITAVPQSGGGSIIPNSGPWAHMAEEIRKRKLELESESQAPPDSESAEAQALRPLVPAGICVPGAVRPRVTIRRSALGPLLESLRRKAAEGEGPLVNEGTKEQ